MLPAPMTVGQYILPEGTQPPAAPPAPLLMERASGPVCSHAECSDPGLVQWSRRPSDDELAQLVTSELERRSGIQTFAERDLPLPTSADTTIAVFACTQHAIHMDHAAQIHAHNCPAPDPARLPDCGCTPEPHPEPVNPEPSVTLPTGWTVTAPPPANN